MKKYTGDEVVPLFGYDAAKRQLREAVIELFEPLLWALALWCERAEGAWQRRQARRRGEAVQEQVVVTVAAFTAATVEAARWVTGDPDDAAAWILKAAGVEVQRG